MAAVTYLGTGKRKTSVARVRLLPGGGSITVNGMNVDDYFGRETLSVLVREPLLTTGTQSRYDVVAKLHGGGKSGQAGALKHGIARALVNADPNLKTDLKRACLTGLATAVQLGDHVVTALGPSGEKRFPHQHRQGFPPEVIVHVHAVYGDAASAGKQTHPRDRGLTLAGAQVSYCCHSNSSGC